MSPRNFSTSPAGAGLSTVTARRLPCLSVLSALARARSHSAGAVWPGCSTTMPVRLARQPLEVVYILDDLVRRADLVVNDVATLARQAVGGDLDLVADAQAAAQHLDQILIRVDADDQRIIRLRLQAAEQGQQVRLGLG